ncbi:AAA domain-containing protein [Pseudomonas fragi]|uniref:AAA domain-containing protein n=1 Tax=Pseudomonas fragi TaxID=296 RepID=UPI0014764894|nr:AAA domain-containing protein [Pseudomonas fragi]NNB17108.1 AAA family ATPase [Pseudomonas fragi]NNB21719.1 AAA family ATPase [Pseudomonas fragi]
METVRARLAGLIEFVKQTALMQKRPALTLSQHNAFSASEEKLRALPGVSLDLHNGEEDEVWLQLERLHETKPPAPLSPLLALWIELKGTPQIDPVLKVRLAREVLINSTAISEDERSRLMPVALQIGEDVGVEEWVNLEDCLDAGEIRAQFKSYSQTAWRLWAAEEKQRRKSIELYAELFMLVQQMQGNLGDAQLELVWGLGVSTWEHPVVGVIHYPLISQLVEIAINPDSMAIEVRPRAAEPRLEVDAYVAADIAGVGPLATLAKDFFKQEQAGISPFNAASYEPVIRSASTLLDAHGQFLPVTLAEGDRSVPKAAEFLCVTDTWCLFARTRDSNMFIEDLGRFEGGIEETGELPAALRAILTEPSSVLEDVALPPFRGLSYVSGSQGGDAPTAKVHELYFPKPYNDEQVQIIQLLEVHDGVVVQGPPGTGKTHTIANVISHYLANGKRVLVTSMKDPALAVLQEKLPEAIRPLAISLLSSEADGMKQFEFAIQKISAEVQRIDRALYKREIGQIDDEINTLHGQMASVDREITHWAERNLSDLEIDGERLSPTHAALQVAAAQAEISNFADLIGVGEEHRPRFTLQDIIALREARLELKESLAYLGQKLPQLADFPDAQTLIQVHQDLAQESQLQLKEATGEVPRLLDNSARTLEQAQALVEHLGQLQALRTQINTSAHSWAAPMQACLMRGGNADVLVLFASLKGEIEEALAGRKAFVARPVSLSFELHAQPEVVAAIDNLAEGRRPFGLSGLIGKGTQKQLLDTIVVLGSKPQSDQDWQHVQAFVRFQQHSRTLLLRWNALAAEIPLPTLETDADQLMAAARAIEQFDAIVLAEEGEIRASSELKQLLPDWADVSQLRSNATVLAEAESILRHYLMRHRLAATWAIKETFNKALAGCGGDISERLQGFLDLSLGQPQVDIASLQSQWSGLMDELRRVMALTAALETVQRVTDLIAQSGGLLWAARLREEPSIGPVDGLLPDNCLDLWRLRRLARYLDSIDGREDLKRLFKLRGELELSLSRLYQDAVVKRTWLRLSENATPSVRAALELYRTAIRKIGKGTGVRAGRYRQDARLAADVAISAIPCWIMPHYRICESLPAQYGAFDLVIIDEASQSDLSALPALLRAKKVLVVGDDKQVSPDGIGMEEERVQNMMARFLGNQVGLYRPLMSPERSLYDLFKVVFAKSGTMLREHFRCVAPIIEYSKREFYNHELKPLRLPMMTERLDPPLVDLLVMDGEKKGKFNLGEAQVIVEEIRRLIALPQIAGRSIGVVSLLGAEQAQKIMQMLTKELGEEIITQFQISCGDARTFQGKERDIMFLSMVASPGDCFANSRDSIAQRFNVAASRARDRMYLVRSVELTDLSPVDSLRRGLIEHFETPFTQDAAQVSDLRELCESGFEQEMYDELTQRGYRVIPQVGVGAYRIDMVVEGDNDSRLAIECDGDRFHGPDRWDSDMRRQRILERAGWRFWRCFASAFTLDRQQIIADLLATLKAMNIEPASGEGAAPSIHVERRQVYGFARAGAVDEEGRVRPYDERPAKDPFLFWVPDDSFALSDIEADQSSPQTV